MIKRYYYCDMFCCEVMKKKNIIVIFVEVIYREMDMKFKFYIGMVEVYYWILGLNYFFFEVGFKFLI